MQTKHLPRTSGIYRIRNVVNGKSYVGSAVDLQVRALGHRRDLRTGKHRNAKLCHAWNKYGERAFVVEVLEAVAAPADLIPREQWWIDTLDAVRRGYNIAPRAGSQLGFKPSPESIERGRQKKLRPVPGFVMPDGAAVTILDMRSFCRDNGLCLSGMYGIANGHATSYCGWAHANAKPKARDWVKTYDGFVDPAGVPVGPVTDLEAFCRERGLPPNGMRRVHAGRARECAGWTNPAAGWKPRPRTRAYGKAAAGFIDPSGRPVTIHNLAAFCRDNGLDERSMCRLRRGVLRQHKGWTHADNADRPAREWRQKTHEGFVGPDGNPAVIVNLKQFCEENGLLPGNMYRLRYGKIPTYKGWTFRPPAVESMERD